MSRRAKEEEDQDSLELLLDTICNVFGGIILMALLVVLQTQASVERIRPRVEIDARKEQRHERAIRRDEEELASLAAEERTLAPYKDEATRAGQVLGRRGEFLSAIEAAQRRLDKAASEVKTQSERTVELDRDRAALEERVKRTGAEVEAAQARAGAVAEAVDRRVRLPLRHSQSSVLQRSVLVSGTRAHLLPEECTNEPVLGHPGSTRHRPQAGTGSPIAEGQATPAFLEECSPGLHFVSFWVSDDTASFETFQRARAAAVSAGYEYTVHAFSSVEGLVLSPGRPDAE